MLLPFAAQLGIDAVHFGISVVYLFNGFVPLVFPGADPIAHSAFADSAAMTLARSSAAIGLL
ncbi:hypothetical protein AB9F26_18415 [Falsihalocynthiibacter sp. BN13B15]|uniref:hypothetical protein n=1 Tax=Falsihalocynthiibacter sp. BN13B15 TaxID=3240871 RepID=UPI00350FAA3C